MEPVITGGARVTQGGSHVRKSGGWSRPEVRRSEASRRLVRPGPGHGSGSSPSESQRQRRQSVQLGHRSDRRQVGLLQPEQVRSAAGWSLGVGCLSRRQDEEQRRRRVWMESGEDGFRLLPHAGRASVFFRPRVGILLSPSVFGGVRRRLLLRIFISGFNLLGPGFWFFVFSSHSVRLRLCLFFVFREAFGAIDARFVRSITFNVMRPLILWSSDELRNEGINSKRMVGGVMMNPIKIPRFRHPGPSWSMVYLVRGGSRPNLTEGSLSAAMSCFVQWYLRAPSHNRLSCGAIWRQNRRLEDTYHVLTGKRLFENGS
ncbi:hypothetical protein M5K25_004965 [Dendrobium thyrsiflorum]|uniref:Uncharacterized protein n=1 Tax=Dendrobium thyrsiflorum TaxID=117978 RepID=A0ABD0VND8_DENTH